MSKYQVILDSARLVADIWCQADTKHCLDCLEVDIYQQTKRLRWSRGSVLAFGKFAGSNPAEAVGFLRAKEKILSTPSFGGEVKPSVPCRIFKAWKRTLKKAWKSLLSAKICRPVLAQWFHLSLLGSLATLESLQ